MDGICNDDCLLWANEFFNSFELSHAYHFKNAWKSSFYVHLQFERVINWGYKQITNKPKQAKTNN